MCCKTGCNTFVLRIGAWSLVINFTQFHLVRQILTSVWQWKRRVLWLYQVKYECIICTLPWGFPDNRNCIVLFSATLRLLCKHLMVFFKPYSIFIEKCLKQPLFKVVLAIFLSFSLDFFFLMQHLTSARKRKFLLGLLYFIGETPQKLWLTFDWIYWANSHELNSEGPQFERCKFSILGIEATLTATFESEM